jgi:hypothetical protein
MNKSGQQMTLGTIIAIVLGIAVLVFLIFGFSTGWNNMWDKITNIGGGKANVDSVVQGCALACVSNGEHAFCEEKRELITEDGSQGSYSCKRWIDINNAFGIQACPNLCSAPDSIEPTKGSFG